MWDYKYGDDPKEEVENHYRTILAVNLLDLEKQVNKLINKGWSLYGNLLSVGDTFVREMVKNGPPS